MPLFAGHILLESEVVDGWIRMEEGRLAEWGEGAPEERPDARGWIVPAPVNAHTHVADAFLRDRSDKPSDLGALVGPGGWKQRMLAASDTGEQSAGVERYLGEMAAIGTSAFIDFRERGLPGVQWLREVTAEAPVRPIILGRPAHHDYRDDEAHDLLRGPDAADGIGLSAMRDFPRQADVEAWAEAAHKARKPFALHVSEAAHESMEAALALEPTFIVHACNATKRELEACADAFVPIVTCPRSNAAFGLRAPVPAMVEAGVTVAVGTDNGMLQDGDLLAELALLQTLDPRLETATLLRMATWGGRKLAGLPESLPPRAGVPLDIIVLPDRPWAAASTKPRLRMQPQGADGALVADAGQEDPGR